MAENVAPPAVDAEHAVREEIPQGNPAVRAPEPRIRTMGEWAAPTERRYIDVACRGSIKDKTPGEMRELISTLAASSRQYGEEKQMQRGIHEIGELASAMNRSGIQGKLPSQTEDNPRENVNAITLRSGKELQHAKTDEPETIPAQESEVSAETTPAQHPPEPASHPPAQTEAPSAQKDDPQIFNENHADVLNRDFCRESDLKNEESELTETVCSIQELSCKPLQEEQVEIAPLQKGLQDQSQKTFQLPQKGILRPPNSSMPQSAPPEPLPQHLLPPAPAQMVHEQTESPSQQILKSEESENDLYEQVHHTQDDEPWYADIVNYLATGMEFPRQSSVTEAPTFATRSLQIFSRSTMWCTEHPPHIIRRLMDKLKCPTERSKPF
ncbi:fibrous sheath CABYR-binding protein-like [Manihot esculenta]|uniref:fibrous sheath CABYR-binding protein-like n=1 Tax=Manihot esculenta TaxID=3983 RepID=UPI001CC55A1F|nr:fibrous sheath CABYR-binding protein-like [Manihot esculenta]